MTSRHTMQVEINANNPAQYLACCGAFEILARFDASAISHWETDSVSRFVMESSIQETEIVAAIVKTFSNWKSCWREQRADESEVVNRIDVSFSLVNEQRATLKLDWWYETLTGDGNIDSRSAWKMYAGNQTAEKTIANMIDVCKELADARTLTTLADLLKASKGMTGRFGFDPSSSRNALDVGYSPNDLNLNVATYPLAELLAMIAAQYFFTSRTRAGGGHQSTRGFVRPDSKSRNIYFRHCMWREWMPILLARVFACGSIADEQTAQMYESFRASRDKYSNLSPSTLTDFKKEANDD